MMHNFAQRVTRDNRVRKPMSNVTVDNLVLHKNILFILKNIN